MNDETIEVETILFLVLTIKLDDESETVVEVVEEQSHEKEEETVDDTVYMQDLVYELLDVEDNKFSRGKLQFVFHGIRQCSIGSKT